MQHITDAMVEAAISPAMAQEVLREAFAQLSTAQAAMQTRLRTECAGVKLSTLGAVIPGQGVVGAKVYTTIAGQFQFVILLFSAVTGEALASFDAAAITRLRTAACSVIAARLLAKPDAGVLGVIGAGVQGQAHIEQLAQAYALREVRVNDPALTARQCDEWSTRYGVPVRACGVAEAVAGADIVVTASRATEPVVQGGMIPAGCFVAAIGSSLPHTRELDDATLARARAVVVEWKPQSLLEAGDLVRAGAGVLDPARLLELGDLISGRAQAPQGPGDISIYKAVGVGLQDAALAGLAWRVISSG